MTPILTVNHISKSYPGLPVIKEASFAVDAGEIICLLGPSGCGKTTLLRIVAGLEPPDTGTVAFDGQDLAGVPVHRRNFGFMFQDYALFPHRDVEANVAFGLRMQGQPSAAIRARVGEMLALVQLEGYERRRVIDLSGGEQQRVALARSLAPGPRLLMLDEPLGALDRALREQLMNELRAILKSVGLTALYVTHDQEEAFAVADRVFVMRAAVETGEGGWIEQAGTPAQVYRYPATTYVARFLGFRNLLDGEIVAAAPLTVRTAAGDLEAADSPRPYPAGARVAVLVRPEAAEVWPEPVHGAAAAGKNLLPGRLLEASFRGSYYLLRTEHAGGVTLVCEASTTAAHLPAEGQPITLRLDPSAITIIERR